jgi:uroporphyrinogen decarboxylase
MHHEQPDRVPVDLGATTLTGMSGACQSRLLQHLGFADTPPAVAAEHSAGGTPPAVDERILQWAGTDFRSVGGIVSLPGRLEQRVSPTEHVDCWGVRRKKIGEYWDIVESPLRGASKGDLKEFPWPEPRVDDSLLCGLREHAQKLYTHTDYVVIGEHPVFGVLELGCWMCGYDEFLVRFVSDPDFVRSFFDRYFAIQMRVVEAYYAAIGEYIHVTMSGDDFGMQSGPLVSPQMFRTFIAPYFAERIRRTKSIADCWFWHHTCGSVWALLDDLVDCGVDILNPIQTSASHMEPAALNDRFGDRVVFWGGVDVQDFLRTAGPDEVRRGVAELVSVLGNEGGYVVSPAHNIQGDVPPENIVAMVHAVHGR